MEYLGAKGYVAPAPRSQIIGGLPPPPPLPTPTQIQSRTYVRTNVKHVKPQHAERKGHVRLVKTRISLGIRRVWSVRVSAMRLKVAKGISYHSAD